MKSYQCTGELRFPLWEKCRKLTVYIACTSRVRRFSPVTVLTAQVLRSDRRKCEITSSWYMGYAWSSQMVKQRYKLFHMVSFLISSGRDAWAKHKNLDTFEAKWLYVEALLKVLRKHSKQPLARELLQEIEAYGGDPSNLVRSGGSHRRHSIII